MSGGENNHFGLTGSIGAGKSTVAERFHLLGARVIDADAISRNALARDGVCFDAVVALFGSSILQPDGSIDRKRVASLVFHDEALRQQLSGIVHPAVYREMMRIAEAERDPHRLVLFDIPLLFESGSADRMRATIVVVADDAVRIRRVMERDGCSAADVAARMRAQMPQEEKMRRADYVIDNSGDLDGLYAEVNALYRRLSEMLV